MQMRQRTIKRRKIFFLNVLLGAVVIFTGPTVYNAIGRFVTTDPFVGLFKKSIKPIDESIGIQMDGVEIRDFDGKRLVSSAFANRVDVRRDRQAATLYGVKNGLY